MRVVLTGYRGTGKTTVGRLVADRLGWPFIDTDPLIEQLAGMPIAQIFQSRGEEYFRDLESQVIADLDKSPQAVISAGGGAILREQNVRHLRSEFPRRLADSQGRDALRSHLRRCHDR